MERKSIAVHIQIRRFTFKALIDGDVCGNDELATQVGYGTSYFSFTKNFLVTYSDID